jgi:Neuraminidase (sialidase)
VLVAFSDERNVGRDVFVNRSGDGGATWLAKEVLVDTTPRTESLGPWPALGAGSDAWVVWEEKRRGEPQIQVSRSRDGGLTWGPPVRVDPKEQEASPIWPVIVESGGRLTVAWTAGVVGDRLRSWLFVASSTDGGATWSAPTVLYEGPAQAVFQLVAHGSSLYMVWNAGGSDGGIGVYFNASDDGGATWRLPLDAPQRIDAAGPEIPAGRPRVAVAPDGATVAVVWQEEEKRIALRFSRDGGRTWPSPPATVASVDKSRVRFPVVAATDKAAWVLWEEWADMTGVRKTLADVEKATPLDVYVSKVTLP